MGWLLVCLMLPTVSMAQVSPAEAPLLIGGMETTGTVEIGNRWRTGIKGSEDLYRSIVNLGEGPRLTSANINMESPLGENRYLDRLQLNVYAWGGDPYNTVRLYSQKADAYDFSFDYRKVDYFNFIPAFANPLLGQGILVGQHSFDSTRRTMDFNVNLRPSRRISPFFAYSRNSGFGPGVTTFTGDGNEFAVNNQLKDTSNYFRGGIRLILPRWNLTLEQGVLTYRDDQRIFQSQGPNSGNRSTPVLGEDIFLGQLDESYRVRGNTPVTRVLVTTTPWEKLTLAGRVVYSRPDMEFDYDRRVAGNFLSFDVLRAYTGELASTSSAVERPHTLGNLDLEYRAHERVTLVNSLVTDHFHTASSSSLGRSLTGTRPLAGFPDPDDRFDVTSSTSQRLAVNLNQNRSEGIFSLNPRLSFRGGYLRVWSDTELQSAIGEEPARSVSLSRDVGLAGFRYRLPKKADFFLDLEAGSGNRVFARTDPLDYRKVRLRGRYRVLESLSFTGSFSLLDHDNKRSDLDYDFQNRGFGLSASFAPADGRRFSANVDYSRSDLNSDILFIIPQLLTTDRSVYVEDSNFAGLDLNFGVVRDIQLTLGYGVLTTSGSLPIRYHQPRARVVVPLNRRVAWTTEWRYYGYNEKQASIQDFRTHLISAGLRFSINP